MKKILTLVAASGMLFATGAVAQSTTQEAVLGASGDPVYTLQVQGANGVLYNCQPEIVMVNGVQARQCVPAGGGSVFANGEGLGAVGAGAGVLVFLAAAAGGSSSTTTTN